MSWQYSAPLNGQTITPAALAAIETDLQTQGGNVDAAAWGITNSSFVVLNPGELPGKTTHTVTGAAYNAGTGIATLTLSATHSIAVNQLVNVTGVSPAGYNGTVLPVTAVTSNTISYAVGTNPGAYSSGGSVVVGPFNPVAGMMAVDVSGNLWVYSGSAWVQQTVTSVNVASATGVLAVAHGGTGTASTLTGLVRGSGSAMTAAELSGDVTTSGSNAATVVKVNGGALPVSAGLVGTNSSGQIILSSAGAFNGFPVNPQTATYAVLAADFSGYKTIVVASGTFTITLVASGTQPANGQAIVVINYGSGTVTIARSGQNINGGTSSITIPAGSATTPTSARIVSDGSNYFAELTTTSTGAGNAVLGQSNLATAGYVPFVSAAGTVNIDTTGKLFWDATNHRLGIGTATPGVTLDMAPVTGANCISQSTVGSTGFAVTQFVSDTQIWQFGTGGSATTHPSFYIFDGMPGGSAGSAIALAFSQTLDRAITYARTPLTGAGLVSVQGSVNLTGQTANIGATNIIASVGAAGMYRVHVACYVTSAGNASSTLPSVTIGYTQEESSAALTTTLSAVTNASSTSVFSSGSFICSCAAASAITYTVASYAAGSPTMQFSLHINVEFLG